MPPSAEPGPPCPHCHRRAAADEGPYCPFCGRHLAPLRWVAEPPPGPPPPPGRVRTPYAGPPRYRDAPRWGFPVLAWEPPAPPGRPEPDAVVAARSVAGTLVPLLWAAAAVALLAAVAEAWRYLLLLASRDGALSAGAVAASDALVVSAGTVAPILAAISGGLLALWMVRASRAAADDTGVRPSRSPRAVALGFLPGPNLTVPGSVLAEIEHMALGRPAQRRPRPSRLLLVGWGLWIASVVLATVVLLWTLRAGVQARADGVVLHAVLDLVAAATAVVMARLVVRLTQLLGPPRARRRELLVSVENEPVVVQAAVRSPEVRSRRITA